MYRAAIALIIGGLLIVPLAEAADSHPQEPTAELPASGNSVGDRVHEEITTGVRKTASWLDSFFSRDSSDSESNDTRLRLRFDSFVENGQGTSFGIGTNVRLRLPGTSNKLMLTFSGSPDDKKLDEDERSDNGEPNVAGDNNEKGRSVGLDYFLKSDTLRLISLQAGVQIHGNSRGAYVGPRYRRYFDTGTWSNRFVQRLREFSTTGLESDTTLDFNHAVFDDLLFRAQWQGSYYNEQAGYFFDVDFRLSQPLSRKRVIEYQFNNSFETAQSNWYQETVLRVRYRQQVWRRWMVLEVSPQIAFDRDNDFDASPGILFRVETVFGG